MQTYTMVGQRGSRLSRPLLTAACAHQWGLSPLPPITKVRWGKPTFQLEHRHFNLSHSGDVALCCLSTTPVGVDIQMPRPSRTAFLDKLCSQEERQWLLTHQDSQEAFALLWAMKESLCKYTGRGITRPLTKLVVPLPHVLPTDHRWLCCPQGDLIFSLSTLHGGAVSVCGTEAVVTDNLLLP